MSGALLAITGSSAGGGGESGGYALTVDDSIIVVEKVGTFTAYGYADSDASYGSFGALAPNVFSGFVVKSLYWVDLTATTTLVFYGDASALSLALEVDGVDQDFGAGNFSGGVTTFDSDAPVANPFTPVSADVALEFII